MGEKVSRIVVFMYHALYDGERARQELGLVDRPYAISVQAFEQQLDFLKAAGIPVLSARQLVPEVANLPEAGVLLTFDDGHASGYQHAAPRLGERGLSGIFFVTSDFIGRRSGFCSWSQLAEMASAGMAVQAHGRTHRFFDDLDTAEARAELVEARAAIESGAGGRVSAISFPGGRYQARDLRLGREAGYRLFFTSEAGANCPEAFAGSAPIRRLVVTERTGLETFARLVTAERAALMRVSMTVGIKTIVRRMVGNRIYQRVSERRALSIRGMVP
jgi:peptidoglycan/xylan/chitin deacetylase (PgdA/CDA1 family)